MIDLLPTALKDMHHWFLVLARFFPLLMFFPGLRNQQVPSLVRVGASVVLSVMITPIVSEFLPPDFPGWVEFMGHALKQFLIGFFFAMVGQFLFAILEMAGEFLSVVSSLSNASLLNPATGTNSSATVSFLGAAGITLLFASDLYLIVIKAYVQSFALFQGDFLSIYKDSAQALLQGTSKMFMYALQFSYPFLIAGLILQITMAMLGKLVPTMQVFLTAMPLQILLTFLILVLVISGILDQFVAIFSHEFPNALTG